MTYFYIIRSFYIKMLGYEIDMSMWVIGKRAKSFILFLCIIWLYIWHCDHYVQWRKPSLLFHDTYPLEFFQFWSVHLKLYFNFSKAITISLKLHTIPPSQTPSPSWCPTIMLHTTSMIFTSLSKNQFSTL